MERYKSINKLKESSKPDAKKMAKFILDNVNLLDEYDLGDTYYRTIANKFKEETGVYVSYDKWGKFSSDSLGFNSTVATYEDLMKEYNKFTASSGLSKAQQDLKQAMSRLSSYFIYEGKGKFRYFNMSTLSDLFFLLDYVKNNKIAKDYADANNYSDKYRDNSSFIRDNAPRNLDVKELGVSIKIQKNGSIVIKGLSSKEDEKIQDVFDLIKR